MSEMMPIISIGISVAVGAFTYMKTRNDKLNDRRVENLEDDMKNLKDDMNKAKIEAAINMAQHATIIEKIDSLKTLLERLIK